MAVSDKRFVKTWMEVSTVHDVAQKLSLSRQTVSTRASSLRQRGVNLPKKHNRHVAHASVADLNSFINSYVR